MLLAGCPAQLVRVHSADVAAHDAATITGEFARFGLQVILRRVDGADLPGVGPIYGGIYSRETEAMIAPGFHVVQVSLWSMEVMSDAIELGFVAAPRGRYEVRAARAPNQEETFWSTLAKVTIGGTERWTIWIVDRDTGKVVPLVPAAESSPSS